MRDTFCSHCGTAFAQVNFYPRVCEVCHIETWRSPEPVVVVLQSVYREEENGSIKTGAIIAKRAIEPKRGEWSLISGYVNRGETVEEAAKREFHEETSLEVMGEPRYIGSRFNDYGILVLFFVIDKPMSFLTFLKGKPCPENEELSIFWRGDTIPLAFPIHEEFINLWIST